ncbi:MAG: FAD/NAD(P)-binding protein [Caulobacteraceae bacterium]|nr:FAD/NAD(P)-binding protein [Caulobacteraceae bacterium]
MIGAGFSGVLTAAHLLRADDGPKVLLIERGPRFGRGAAYATASPHHLLNVRGANMSAFPEAPSHFLNWLGVDHTEGEAVFVTRDRYGQYLQSVLREAAGRDPSRLVFEHDAAVTLAPGPSGWAITLAMGRTLVADAVVLAIGNLPPPVPPQADRALLASHRWVPDPWEWIGSGPSLDGDALLLGAGLTAVDVALSIEESRPGTYVLALSRHGLVPQAHGPAPGRAVPAPSPSGSAAEVFAKVRAQAKDDWRATIDALRPHVQALWRGWSLADRRRFLRHARPWWEVSRHRLAPDVDDRLSRLRDEGLVEVAAGRLQNLALVRGGVEARWAPRGGGPIRSRRFCVVVNCVGPLSDLRRSEDPLVRSLLQAGLIRPDRCRLGLDVDGASRPLADDGTPSPGLFAVGPLTRGEVYEMTSVPDIRIQAADVAQSLLSELAGRAGADVESCAGERLTRDLRRYLQERSDELDVEIEAKSVARRMRVAWELRGRRAAFDDVADWLEARQSKGPR